MNTSLRRRVCLVIAGLQALFAVSLALDGNWVMAGNAMVGMLVALTVAALAA